MLDFKVETKGIKELEQFLAAVSNANRPTAVAMTRTARMVQQDVKEATPQFVDQPTRWTMNSTFVKGAKPDNLTATVGFKDYSNTGVPAATYLQPIAAGGTRPHKPFERRLQSRGILGPRQFAVPSGIAPATFNSYGNLPANQYVKILSQLRALREVGSTQNATASPRSRSKRRQTTYFVGTVNGNRGVYVRQGSSRIITPVFWFVNRSPQYDPTFPIARILRESFDKHWPEQFERAIADELRYLGSRGR